MSRSVTSWRKASQTRLKTALSGVRTALEQHAAKSPIGTGTEGPSLKKRRMQGAKASQTPDFPNALDRLCESFNLSAFERAVLLLCSGMELEAAFAPLCAAAQGDAARPWPTFSLALAALRQPDWRALSPSAPLRRWKLIEIGSGPALTLSPLRVDEFVLHYLAGERVPDERLAVLLESVHATADLVPSHSAVAAQMAEVWLRSKQVPLPVLQLCGRPEDGKRDIAAAGCERLGLSLAAIPSHLVPTSAGDLNTLVRLLTRQSALHEQALLLDCDDTDPADAVREAAITRMIDTIGSPLIVTTRTRRTERRRPMIAFDVCKATSAEQRSVWEAALGSTSSGLNGQVETLITQFNLSPNAIRAACSRAAGQSSSTAPADLSERLWDSCRIHARPRLDDLAERLEPGADWDDLILNEAQKRILREIATHVRHRYKVYGTWGFAQKLVRGLGISALFAGQSGTGKTMAAEVLASALRLDLYRIDLSSVVSKYIGETEKNLRRVFDAAEGGGSILLFDEADALFGKRSEVKDSHDRYANIEVSYLLQKMEAYRGLAILTTNRKDALDPAFLRRLRFIVQFPFPDVANRAEIWRHIFPGQTPTEGLDLARLARLNIAGGNIRNIAVNAAFLAADAGEPVGMAHIFRAAQSEYAKLEKPFSEVEAGGWKS